MLPDAKIKCHHTGFAKRCCDMVSKHGCQKFVRLLGSNPQTGAQVDEFGCIDKFLHLLLIENSQMQRQTGAAVENFRNEMARAGGALIDLAQEGCQRALSNGHGKALVEQ